LIDIRVVSLNCHGCNVGIEAYLDQLLSTADIILLQETRLSNFTSSRLQNDSDDFQWHHTSAMEEKLYNNILYGHPICGIALVLWSTCKHQSCSNLPT